MLLTSYRTSAPDPKGIIFPRLESWNPLTEVATVAANVNKQRVLCRISLSILRDKFGVQDEAPMRYVARHRTVIQNAARRLIENGTYEDDGSVVIRAQDL